MGPDESRAVHVRVSVRGGRRKHGSGYVIAPTLVLTAAHALRRRGLHLAPGDACEVLRNGDDHRDGWLGGCVKASDLKADLAVISVPGLGGDLTPTAWGRLETDTGPVKWRAIGFPLAARTVAGRSPEEAWGEVSPASARDVGRLALTVDSRCVRPRADGASGWGGLSGAAVFCHDHLVGVIVEDAPQFVGSVTARRGELIESSPSLYEAAGSPPIARICATGMGVDLDRPDEMWVAVVAGFVECVRRPYPEKAGRELGLRHTTWDAHAAHTAIADRLLRSTLHDASKPLGYLVRGLDDPRTARRLVDGVLPIWVDAEAASCLHRAVKVDRARVLLVNVNHEQSAREYLQRAWCCDLDDWHIIGIPGVAGEEQLDSVRADVRAGLERAWGAGTPPDGVDEMLDCEIFVLVGQPWAPGIIADAVFGVHPGAHMLMYTGPEYHAVHAAVTEARLVEPLTSPEHEDAARRLHGRLLSAITGEPHGR